MKSIKGAAIDGQGINVGPGLDGRLSIISSLLLMSGWPEGNGPAAVGGAEAEGRGRRGQNAFGQTHSWTEKAEEMAEFLFSRQNRKNICFSAPLLFFFLLGQTKKGFRVDFVA